MDLQALCPEGISGSWALDGRSPLVCVALLPMFNSYLVHKRTWLRRWKDEPTLSWDSSLNFQHFLFRLAFGYQEWCPVLPVFKEALFKKSFSWVLLNDIWLTLWHSLFHLDNKMAILLGSSVVRDVIAKNRPSALWTLCSNGDKGKQARPSS